eukprot:1267056-Prymnesium_polylepis.1
MPHSLSARWHVPPPHRPAASARLVGGHQGAEPDARGHPQALHAARVHRAPSPDARDDTAAVGAQIAAGAVEARAGLPRRSYRPQAAAARQRAAQGAQRHAAH